jgi:hypothetical protein
MEEMYAWKYVCAHKGTRMYLCVLCMHAAPGEDGMHTCMDGMHICALAGAMPAKTKDDIGQM